MQGLSFRMTEAHMAEKTSDFGGLGGYCKRHKYKANMLLVSRYNQHPSLDSVRASAYRLTLQGFSAGGIYQLVDGSRVKVWRGPTKGSRTVWFYSYNVNASESSLFWVM